MRQSQQNLSIVSCAMYLNMLIFILTIQHTSECLITLPISGYQPGNLDHKYQSSYLYFVTYSFDDPTNFEYSPVEAPNPFRNGGFARMLGEEFCQNFS